MLAIKRGIFQFRAVIPTELRPTLNKREIWRSLGTSNKAEALKLEAKASYELDALLQRIRAIVTPKQPFKQITSLFVDANAGTVKAEGDLTSADMAELGKLVATITGEKTAAKLLSSDEPVNLKEKLPDYINEKIISKAWASDKTKDCAVGYINAFFEFAGDKPVTKAVVADFKKDLLGQTMRGGLPMSVNTVNKYLTALSGYFKFLFRNEVIPQNYCDGMLIATRGKGATDPRKAFEIEDLKRIFSVTDIETSDAMRWIPRLALFTGCRINELCQLHISDVREIDGIWCLDINADTPDKRVKSDSGERIVPLHDDIREAFVAHVQSIDKGSVRVFPELVLKRDGYSQDLSKKFGRLLRNKVGITDPQLVFHSFRHTFATALKRALVPQDVAGALAGHKNESMTYGVYGKEYPVSILKEAIDQLKFNI